jgi:hypothetical protein
VEQYATPTLVSSLPFVAIATDQSHAFALTTDGAAYCWGFEQPWAARNARNNRIRADSVTTSLRLVQSAAGAKGRADSLRPVRRMLGSDQDGKFGRACRRIRAFKPPWPIATGVKPIRRNALEGL